MIRTTLIVVSLALAACGGTPAAQHPEPAPASAAQPAEAGQSPTAAALIQKIQRWNRTAEVAIVTDPAHSLREFEVRVDGRPVWPPQGPSCGQLVECCQEMVKRGDDMELVCQFSVTMDSDCKAALATVKDVISENNRLPPNVCGR